MKIKIFEERIFIFSRNKKIRIFICAKKSLLPFSRIIKRKNIIFSRKKKIKIFICVKKGYLFLKEEKNKRILFFRAKKNKNIYLREKSLLPFSLKEGKNKWMCMCEIGGCLE